MFEEQIEKCEICNGHEYVGWELFTYKGIQVLARVCSDCAEVLMSDQFAQYRTIIPREDRHVKTLKRR